MSSYVFGQKPELEDLEHFGVKGMKWGVRKERSAADRRGKSKDEKSAKRRRAAQIAVVAGVVVAGAIIAHRSGVRMSSFSNAPGSSTVARSLARERALVGASRSREAATIAASRAREQAAVQAGARRTAAVLNRVGQQRFSAIPMPPVGGGSTRASNRFLRNNRLASSGRPRPVSRANEIAALRSSIADTIRSANADLRARDNSLNIPFSQRSYIPEWND